MNQMLTKEEAMRKFGIDDLRKFNTKDFIKVMSSIDKMDPEVAKELIAQIPNFLNFAQDAAKSIKESYTETLKSDNESLNKVYASYDLLIDSLNADLKDGELSLDEKFEISNLIRDLIHDKEDLHFKQQQERHELFKSIAKGVCVTAVAIVGLLSGAEFVKHGNNEISHDDLDD